MGKSAPKKSPSKPSKTAAAKGTTARKGPAARTAVRGTTPAKSGKPAARPAAPAARSVNATPKGTSKGKSTHGPNSSKPAGKGVPTVPVETGVRRRVAEQESQSAAAAREAAGRASPRQNSPLVAGRPQDAHTRPHRSHTDPIAPVPVPTAASGDGKPKKNQAGLNTRELEHFRDLLLEKRRELVGDMSSMEREALRQGGGSNLSTLPIHMADMGTDNYEQEFTLGLVEKDRTLLREINRALVKIQDGTFGICEGTGQPIARARLEAQPWARFSIEYARSHEKPVMRR